MRYLLICMAILTCVFSCNHQHHKEKYGHFSQFGDRFNDLVHTEHHHTHFHGNVAIIKTPDAPAALDKIASALKETPTAPVNANKQLFSIGDGAATSLRIEQKYQYEGRSRPGSRQHHSRKEKRLSSRGPLVDVPFSVQIVKEYIPRSLNK